MACACSHIYTHLCAGPRICTHVPVHVHRYTHICVQVHTYAHTVLCMFTHIYTFMCRFTHMDTHSCAGSHIMHTCSCAGSYIGLPASILCAASLTQTPFWSYSTSPLTPHESQVWELLKIMRSESPETADEKGPQELTRHHQATRSLGPHWITREIWTLHGLSPQQARLILRTFLRPKKLNTYYLSNTLNGGERILKASMDDNPTCPVFDNLLLGPSTP